MRRKFYIMQQKIVNIKKGIAKISKALEEFGIIVLIMAMVMVVALVVSCFTIKGILEIVICVSIVVSCEWIFICFIWYKDTIIIINEILLIVLGSVAAIKEFLIIYLLCHKEIKWEIFEQIYEMGFTTTDIVNIIYTLLFVPISVLNLLMVVILFTRNFFSEEAKKEEQELQIQLLQEQIREIQEKLNNK